MTIKELIEILKGLDQESLVVMASDGEGNDYSPFFEAMPCLYSGNKYSGECVNDEQLKELKEEENLTEEEFEEERIKRDIKKAVCLWPTN